MQNTISFKETQIFRFGKKIFFTLTFTASTLEVLEIEGKNQEENQICFVCLMKNRTQTQERAIVKHRNVFDVFALWKCGFSADTKMTGIKMFWVRFI